MNPFDLRGPQFLLFYAVLALLTIWFVRRMRMARELEAQSRGRLDDPYKIALLRGGPTELVRVALVSLVDRGLLQIDGNRFQTTDTGKKMQVRRSIERSILEYCTQRRKAADLFRPGALGYSDSEYGAELRRLKFLPDDAIRAMRLRWFALAASVLLFFAITKIVVAISRGDSTSFFS